MTKQSDKLLIIDGYGFIFRAYYVLPPLTNDKGEPVGALYGFTSMLLKVINDFKPTHAVVVFDTGGKNFRHKIYDQYKAHRPSVPEDLIAQLPQMRPVAKALNFAILEKEGVEADDIIATLQKKAMSINARVVIISSDKDLMQLIDKNTEMFDSIKNKYITDQDVVNKFGVEPKKLREVLALMGDSSDNIPGVHGIGPKTAADLIKQFGSVDRLLSSIDQLKSARLQEILKSSVDSAKMSWELVGLNDDVEGLNYDLNSFVWTPPPSEKISEFLNNYNFKSLYKRVESLFNYKITEHNHLKKEIKSSVESIATKDKFEKVLKYAEDKGMLSIYLLRIKDKPILLIIAIESGCYIIDIPLTEENSFYVKGFIDLFISKNIKKITYNIKSLLRFFTQKTGSIESFKAFEDLELMQYANSAGLKQNNKLETESYTGLVKEFSKKYYELLSKLNDTNSLSLYRDIDLPLSYILHKMECYGIKVDINKLKKLSQEFSEEITKLEEEIYKITAIKFNISSPKQLGEVLFEKMQLPFGKLSTKAQNYSTNAEVLEKLSEEGHSIADLLLKWRQLTKLKSTYTDALVDYISPNTKRIHTTFLQNITTTGRLSSQDPNLQNIPIRSNEGNKIRAAFVAEEGCKLISADYSQIELRILSEIADVEALKKAFVNGEDIHSKTACNIFKISPDQLTSDHRRKAKAINFGIIYGISPFGLSKQLSISTSLAGEYIKKYFEEYPEIKEYMEKTKSFARQHGYVLNLFGRRCFVPSINDRNNAIRQFAERAAINAPIQGTSADIIKLAMINLDRELEKMHLSTKMILQIHDELIFEVPEKELPIITEVIKSTMVKCPLLNIPLVVDVRIGDNWMDAK